MPFFAFLFAIIGAGLDGFYQLTLDEAVRNAARQIQIDGPASINGGNFIAAVCSEFAAVAPTCTTTLSYNVQTSAAVSGFATLVPMSLSGSGKLPNGFFAGSPNADNVSVLVQVAYPLPFYIPYFSTLITSTGTASILATTSVRIEPF